jgi:predicted nucleic acid-binding protein
LSDAYLADKSALARLNNRLVADALRPLMLSGRLATCGIVELEVLYSAVNAADLSRIRVTRQRAFRRVPMDERDFERAADVMALLSQTGSHRAAGIPDLLISAVAERTGLTVIHYDHDFETIAAATGQPHEWVVPRGSVP